MIPVVSFIGESGSGKTTFLEKVVRELKLKGYRVAVVKHSHHDFDTDRPGKDTWRLAQAGSDIVAISAPGKVALTERVDEELTLPQVKALFGERVDIILTEGYKNGNAAKILVLGPGQNGGNLHSGKATLTDISVRGFSAGVPQFAEANVTRVVKLVIDLMARFPSQPVSELEALLAESAAHHGHLCPAQVLGVRMALRGCQELSIKPPGVEKKRLVVYTEIDRCATDAIQVVTGCKLGKRTLKYIDYGKLAATFVDLPTGNAVRLVAREDAREKAARYHRQGWTKIETEVAAYQIMTDEELFHIQRVAVSIPVEDMPGPPRRRVICTRCGEGVNDSREVTLAGKVLCRACAYGSYYRPCPHDSTQI